MYSFGFIIAPSTLPFSTVLHDSKVHELLEKPGFQKGNNN
jgi:hypothetical protein